MTQSAVAQHHSLNQRRPAQVVHVVKRRTGGGQDTYHGPVTAKLCKMATYSKVQAFQCLMASPW